MNKWIGNYVIVRGDRSGVFAGTLFEKDGQEVLLKDARKLFYWDGAGAVEQIAVDGVSRPENCKFTIMVDELIVTDAIQILPCTGKAENIIKGVKAWKY
jgi:hypothetical protein